MSFDHDTRLASYALIVRDGAVLLSWYGRGQLWTLPGGGVEWGEAPDEALVREVLEETGYHVNVDAQLTTTLVHWPEDHHSPRGVPYRTLRVIHIAHVVGGTLGTLEQDGTTERAAWVPLGQLSAEPHSTAIDEALTLAGHR